jgi:hypothetical protein
MSVFTPLFLNVRRLGILLVSLSIILIVVRCGRKSSTTTTPTPTTTTTSHIYLSSGTTYAGSGVTMSSPSNVISKYSIAGAFESILVDYSDIAGDSPVGMLDYDADSLLVVVENALGRRIEKVSKVTGERTTFLVNSTALSAQLRSLALTVDGGYLVSKGTAIEKFSSTKARVLQGAAPFISAPGGTCATSTTLIPAALVGPGGSIIMLHAGATPNNKINLINKTGYSVGADCLASVTGSTVNHIPTTALLHSSGKLFVGFSSTTGPVNDIFQYDVTSSTITNAALIGRDAANIQGITALAELPDGTILIANGASTFNTIEAYTYDATTPTLTRVGTSSFIPASLYTRSISAIVIAD